MAKQFKTVDIAIKAAGPEDGLEEGEFIGYASVFDNIDRHGDVVRKGAFKATLAEWEKAFKESGAVIPLLYGHDTTDPNNNIGYLKMAEEDEIGLKVHGKIDLDGPPTSNGPQVYRLVKGRRLRQMSYAYEVRKSGPGVENEVEFNELLDLGLFETSLVPIGANPLTDVIDVKHDDGIVDRVVKEIVALIKSGNLSTKGATQQAREEASAKDEEPAEVKSEEPKSEPSAMLLSALIESSIE